MAEGKSLVEEFHASREVAYKGLIAVVDRLRRKAALGFDPTSLFKDLRKVEREFRAERRRDYFRSPLRSEAAAALHAVRRVLKEGVEVECFGDAGGGSSALSDPSRASRRQPVLGSLDSAGGGAGTGGATYGRADERPR